MTDKHDRRTFLKIAGSTGAIGITGLAGCSGSGGDGDSGGDTETEASSGDTETEASGGTTSSAGSEADLITLGGSMSLTGDNADLGRLYRDAYQETIDRINEAGGVEAGDGNTYELEMVLRDDGTDASTSRSIYQELIDREGIDYLLRPNERSRRGQSEADGRGWRCKPRDLQSG